jgi:hypothetical protein
MHFGRDFKRLAAIAALVLALGLGQGLAGAAQAETLAAPPEPAQAPAQSARPPNASPNALPNSWPAHPASEAPLVQIQASPPSPPTPPANAREGARSWRVSGDQLVLRDLAAIVFVMPEPRADIHVTLLNPGPLPDPQVRQSGQRAIIDGGLRRNDTRCQGDGGDFAVRVSGRGVLSERQLPTLEVRVPETVSLNADGALRLWIGPARDARVAMEACGEADMASVSGDADIAVSGGGATLRLHEVVRASVRIAGAGEIELGVVSNGLAASIAGAGEIRAARVDGPTNIAIQGAGEITIDDGRAEALSVAIAGSGDVRHDGVADTLDVVILGAGDVHVRRVEGQISRRVLGGGSITVGR